MLAVKGIYHNGNLVLEQPVQAEQPVQVIVTFLEETVTTTIEEAEIRKNPLDFAGFLIKGLDGLTVQKELRDEWE